MRTVKTLVCCVATMSEASEQSSWVLEKDQDDIKIYSMPSEGSTIRHIKAEMQLNTTLFNLLALFKDAKACSEWRYQCREMVLLDKQYLYRLNDVPWPVKDRFVILNSVHENNNREQFYQINFHSIKQDQLPAALRSAVPDTRGAVEMERLEGSWQFRFLDDEDVKITLQLHGEPGGSLPASVINYTAIKGAYQTLKKMRPLLRDPRYQPGY